MVGWRYVHAAALPFPDPAQPRMRVTFAAAGPGRAGAAGPAPATHPVRAQAARRDRDKASPADRSSAAALDRARGLVRAGLLASALGDRALGHPFE